MALRLYRANRVENLLDQLMEVLGRPLDDPFLSEQIMVQNPGMATWLGRKLADRFGICAGAEFLFPRKLIGKVFHAVLGDDAFGVHAYDPHRLVWAVLARLPELLDKPEFALPRRYLRHDVGDRKRVQLARRIADVFDQYALYRPEMVLAWDAGAEQDWQAMLWRDIAARLGNGHVAALTQNFDAAMAGSVAYDGLPTRLCCFGISTLPPLYIHVLHLLATRIEVHFFLLQPTAEFFADIRSRGEIDYLLAKRRDHTRESLMLHEGHPLLASLGRMGRDFQELLLTQTHYQEQGLWTEPDTGHMLGVLQHDMLHLQRRGLAEEHPPLPLHPDDHSISIHACHGPMREVEVLRDQLLALFDSRPDLSPGDVVVMMPDVETYAPLIEAGFASGGTMHLPFSVADRTFRGASPAIDAFFRVLDLQLSRAGASEILDLLALAPVHRRFNIAAEELETLQDWVVAGGIRWGMDAGHRAAFDQPLSAQNTWKFGMERLLLGYALPEEDALFAGALPRDQVEGIEARLLGRFAHFCAALFGLLGRLRGKRTVVGWQKLLLRLLDALVVADGENEWQHQQIRTALDNLVQEAGDGGYQEALDLAAVRGLLEDRIEYENAGWNFLAEGITFCAMVPMRSIPFRVVAMMGMDDRAFPRSMRPENFDKIAENPRTGDRAKRNEERYLFLEALLAARERLIITYVGQDIKDNAALPPSVVVSELIDCLAETFTLPDAAPGDRDAMAARLVVTHPMQGFNPLYFDPDRRPELFSYSESGYQGAQGFVGRRTADDRFFTEPFPPAEVQTPLPLEQLVRFYRKPIGTMLKQRLGFSLDAREREISDREPLELDRLERFRAGSELMDRELNGLDERAAGLLARAEGRLPLGTPGDLYFQDVHRELKPLVTAVHAWAEEPCPPLDAAVDLGDTIVYGRLHGRYARGQLWYQYKRISGKHLLEAWLRHLVMCAAAPTDQAHVSVWLGRGDDGAVTSARFEPVAEPEAHLRDLVALYHIGLREPLLLFPKASLAFARAESEQQGFRAAESAWRRAKFPECDEPHHARTFGDQDVLKPDFSLFDQPMAGGDFPTLARRVFGPLLRHLAEEVAHAGV